MFVLGLGQGVVVIMLCVFPNTALDLVFRGAFRVYYYYYYKLQLLSFSSSSFFLNKELGFRNPERGFSKNLKKCLIIAT